LGTRGEIEPSAPKHSNHSGILIDNKMMFDLGEEKFLREKPNCIFITHLHPDHAFFARRPITPPAPSCLKRGIKIFAPEKYAGFPQIKIAKRINKINGYKITAIPTIHSLHVKSCAYFIEKGGKKILYTGDMIWIKKTYHHFLKNLDAVITEGSFIKKGGMVRRGKTTRRIFGHNGIPDLIKFFSKFTKQIILVHFGSWFYKDADGAKKKIKKLGKIYETEMNIGYDGMKTSI